MFQRSAEPGSGLGQFGKMPRLFKLVVLRDGQLNQNRFCCKVEPGEDRF